MGYQVRIPDSLNERLENIINSEQYSYNNKAELVREALRQYLNNLEKKDSEMEKRVERLEKIIDGELNYDFEL